MSVAGVSVGLSAFVAHKFALNNRLNANVNNIDFAVISCRLILYQKSRQN